MYPKSVRPPGTRAANDPWNYIECAPQASRVDLINKYNSLAGPPSNHMRAIQEEFIDARMETRETISFAKVLLGLIAAAENLRKFQ